MTLRAGTRLRFWAAILCLGALAACASPREMRFEMLDVQTAPGQRRVYPAPPEVPRYLYLGQLIGEANFRAVDEQTRTVVNRLVDFITGLNSADAPRMELQRPVTGAVDDRDRVLVTDASRQAVYVFDTVAGRLEVWEQAVGVEKFVSPAGIAMGRNGEVLVADAELALVARLDARGNPVGVMGRGLLKRPTGLARDPEQGLIFVADTYAHDVKVFNDEGQLVNLIGRRGGGPGEFNYPTHIAYARGALYVTDTLNNRVQIFGAGGDVHSGQFGERGLNLGNLVRPKGISVDNEGHIYVVEGYYDYLLVFDRSGRLLLPIGEAGEPWKFYLPNGVWVDRRNRVFVADMFNGRVMVYQFLGGE